MAREYRKPQKWDVLALFNDASKTLAKIYLCKIVNDGLAKQERFYTEQIV